jgi:hypothetical protein
MRPRRPRGLTIALLACTVLYGLYPLAQGLFFIFPAFSRPTYEVQPRVALNIVLGLAFLILMIPAWRGRPPRIRLVLTGAVLGLMLLYLGFAVADLAAQSGLALDSTSALDRTTATCSIPFYLLLTTYIVWYLNRYPSRAYYRGAATPPATEDSHA